jgi:hypothetical protein
VARSIRCRLLQHRDHLTQYNGTLTYLDAGKEDARSSEQHVTLEQAIGDDGMTPKFDDEIPFAPCWQ